MAWRAAAIAPLTPVSAASPAGAAGTAPGAIHRRLPLRKGV
jgi:hypothetical protein